MTMGGTFHAYERNSAVVLVVSCVIADWPARARKSSGGVLGVE
jgi:hypothetical protein